MSVRIASSSTAGVFATGKGIDSNGTPLLASAPQLPVSGLGVAGMVAMLVSQSAHENAKAARQMEVAEKEAQASALERQVAALHEKAADTRADGIVSGAMTAAGGVVTLASVAAMPAASDGKAEAAWKEAGEKHHGAFTEIGGQCSAQMKTMQATSEAIRTSGSTVGTLGTQIARATYGANQIADEANSTKAAADAKFHEAAKDEYASLAKEAKGTADKVNQFLQSVLAEKQMTMRGILKMA